MTPPDISALNFEQLIAREWLAVNSIGGYASSTLCGLNTRKYHGLLVAAMSPPVRRMVLLSHVDETVLTETGSFLLSVNEYPGTIFPEGYKLLRAFNADPFPRWAYQGDGFTLEKSLHLLKGQNTVCITYTLLGGTKPVTLEARPLLAMRGIHELSYQWNGRLLSESRRDGSVRIPATTRTPEIFFAHDGEFRSEPYWYLNAIFRREQERGYGGLEDQWDPGIFRWVLSPGQSVHLACSAEPVKLSQVIEEIDRVAADLGKQVSTPDQDENLTALVRAASDYVLTLAPESPQPIFVILQYPWSPPSGRAAMIGMAGLFLVTGRFDEARRLLISLAAAVQDGLVPTEFPEAGGAPLYNGADTSLWFINAVGEYLKYTEDETTARSLLPVLETIISAYSKGTKLGISMDSDGLIASRAGNDATSWMDARAGDWVMTPRSGKTVELNALWYNALRTVSALAQRFGEIAIASDLDRLADRVEIAFNDKFWNEKAKCCFDFIDDGITNGSIRPNQIFAVSLPHPVLRKEFQQRMLHTVVTELLTPMGVRTLSPRDSAYQGRYAGNILSREKAQHQGSAYPWLLGALGTALIRSAGRDTATIARIQQWLQPSLEFMKVQGVGQIGELFDGDTPQNPGGAIASSLSIAEILRCYAQDVLGITAAIPPKPKIVSPTSGSPLASGRQ